MSVYEDLLGHVGHDIECVTYGTNDEDDRPQNVTIECETCMEVIVDEERPIEDPLNRAYKREKAKAKAESDMYAKMRALDDQSFDLDRLAQYGAK